MRLLANVNIADDETSEVTHQGPDKDISYSSVT